MPVVLWILLVRWGMVALDMATTLDSRRLHAIRIERGRGLDSEQLRSRLGTGLCECGCGGRTQIAKRTRSEAGWVRGQPLRFIAGHQSRTKQRPPLGSDDYTKEPRGHKTRCWIRRGRLNNKGYGVVHIAGRIIYAHRAMYEQEVGQIPDGMELDHLCRQPACMNPSHLEVVTHAVNLQRGKGAKLTSSAVAAIRATPADVRTKDLAEQYGISESQMSRVRRGLRWRNLDPD